MTRPASVTSALSTAAVLCVLLLAPLAHAQSPEATISGIVSDGTRAALPGVTITALHPQLRVEAFNAFNHPDFGLPAHTFGAPNFGVISSASEGGTVQLGVRFVY